MRGERPRTEITDDKIRIAQEVPFPGGRQSSFRNCLRSSEEKPVNCSDKLMGKQASGEGGIRTHGALTDTPVFKTGALNHSATSPGRLPRTRLYSGFPVLSRPIAELFGSLPVRGFETFVSVS